MKKGGDCLNTIWDLSLDIGIFLVTHNSLVPNVKAAPEIQFLIFYSFILA